MSFPVTIVDDFYENPDDVIKFAQSLPYDNPFNGKSIWIGRQTASLHEVDPVFFENFCQKLFSIFFDFSKERSIQWQIDTRFSKIDRIHDDFCNQAWIHRDEGELLAGVIYLNNSLTQSGGTSIYQKKYDIELDYDLQKEFYRDPDNVISDCEKMVKYKEQLTTHLNSFEESISIKNVFNRMICYDARNFHNIKSVNVDNCDYRLTQVFFVRKLAGVNYPCDRLRNKF